MTVLVRTFILEHRSKKWLWSFLLSPFRWLCCPTDRAALVQLNLTSLSQLTTLHTTHYPLGGLQKGLLVDLLVLSTVILLNSAAALSPQHRYQLQQGERSPFLPILVGVPLDLISELSNEDLGGSPPALPPGREALPWKCSVPEPRSALVAELERSLQAGSGNIGLSWVPRQAGQKDKCNNGG